MYAFKVIVSTLIVLMICLLGFAANKGGGKLIATLMIIVYMLSFVAIWG